MRNLFLILLFLLPFDALAESPLEREANTLLSTILQQESHKDATCWTTARMMESFYTKMPVSEQAALLNVEIVRTVSRTLWHNASLRDSNCVVTDTAMKHAIDDFTRNAPFLTRPVGLQVSEEYQRITENWRALLSATIGAPENALEELSTGARAELSQFMARFILNLLARAASIAKEESHEMITADDIKRAYAPLLEHATTNTTKAHSCPSPALSEKVRREITQKNAQQKVRSLREWNKVVWTSQEGLTHARKLLQELIAVQLSKTALNQILFSVSSSAQYISLGNRPERSQLMHRAPSLFNHHSPRRGRHPDAPQLLELSWIYNVAQDIFPRHTDQRGDVHVLLESDNGELSLRLEAPFLDAVRDTTLHWSLIAQIWNSSDAIPLDPFAGELLAERVSEMIGLWARLVEHYATKNKLQSVNGTHVQSLGLQYSLAEPFPPSTTTASWNTPKKLQERFARPFFKDITTETALRYLRCNPKSQEDLAKLARGQDNVDLAIQRHAGSGIAVGDVDRNGFVDLFVGGDSCNRLLLNKGNYQFEDATQQYGLSQIGEGVRHPLFADVDNNGLLDLFLVHEEPPSQLFLQTSPGKFTHVAGQSGIRTRHAAHSAVFLDYDRDGFLDLYVNHYGRGSGISVLGRNAVPNQLYRNNGDGSFTDVTQQAGVGSRAWSLTATAVDVNNDHQVDLFIANDFGDDELYLNNGDGTFREAADLFGVADRGNGMNATVTDLNNDGSPDLYVAVIDMFNKNISFRLPKPESLYSLSDSIIRSSFTLAGNRYYEASREKESRENMYLDRHRDYFQPIDYGWGWASRFFDYENDGDLDFYLVNGWLDGTNVGSQRNVFSVNESGRFYVTSEEEPARFLGLSRTVLPLDLTNSGKVDLLVQNLTGPPTLLANQSESSNQWITVRLPVGDPRGTSGSSLALELSDGTVMHRFFSLGDGYLSQQDNSIHFGIPKGKIPRKLTVHWANGNVTTQTDPQLGSIIQMTEQ